MLTSFRSALLLTAALTSTSIGPAFAGTSPDAPVPVASATLPKVAIPDLLDSQAEPTLSQPATSDTQAETPETDAPDTAAAEPAMRPSGDLAAMVTQLRGTEPGSAELNCLATGIYFESKGEPLAGQLAVGRVIANRAASGGRFPSTYCGVLFQHGQFSFVHGRSLPAVPRANKMWQTAVAMAKIVDQRLHDSAVGNALFFHARYVAPGWHLKRIASIGNHIFYR